jgi:hypothetical protein
MDEDGSAEGGRTRLARGTKPNVAVGEHARTGGANADAELPAATAPRGGGAATGRGPAPAGGAPSAAGRAPAQSICEAVEQLIEAQEAEEAIAEWMRGGG